jgi:hypothetical protein
LTAQAGDLLTALVGELDHLGEAIQHGIGNEGI